MLKLIEILRQKTYKLMWQEYDRCHLNNIINEYLNFFFFIGDMLVFKTYIVSLAHFGWINHINEYE